MTSPRTETSDRPDETAEKPPRTQLSATQVVAGALAAVSAAVLASFFGVAGTVIGAALVSVVSTTGSAVYSASLSRTTERLRKVRTQIGGRPSATADAAGDDTATRVLPAHLDPRRAAPASRPLLARVRWPRVAAYTAAVFVLAMAVVTGIELIGQKPVSALVGSDTSSSSTTLGELATVSSSQDTTPTSPATTSPADGTTEAPASTAPESGAEESGSEESDSSTPATSTSESSPTDDDGGSSDTSSDTDTGTDSGTEGDSGTDSGTDGDTGGGTSEQTGQSTQEPQAGGATGAEPTS
ncbi:hypothetical protein [Geodermatophilus maliterrae]|uniref:Uncharacterized protein n=1 Tax=Geodermatophilus maliterrae TaxID=3162531 RepID=A0ABV3XGM3_9ACTN